MNKTTAKVILDCNFDVRKFSVYGCGASSFRQPTPSHPHHPQEKKDKLAIHPFEIVFTGIATRIIIYICPVLISAVPLP